MQFSRKTVLAILAQAIVVLGQSNNAFNVPTTGYNSVAGETLTLNWTPTSSGTVSLILRSGASSNLNAGTYVAQGIQNSGSYTWTLPSDITRGSDYAIEIVSDADPTITNYTPYFVIDSTNTVASVTSDISLGATGTATPTSSGVLSGSATGSSVSSAIASVSSRASSVSASISSAVSSLSSAASASASSASASGSSAVSSASGSARSSASSAASSVSSAAASASSSITVPSTGAAAMATAFPGLMGALALGALVL